MNPRKWWEELVYDTFISAGVPKTELDPKFNILFDSLYERFTGDRGYSVFPDVHDTLVYLKNQDISTGVISNSDERLSEVLHNLGIRPYFDFVLPSYRAGYEKPEKEIFDQALRIMHPYNPTRPDQALHIGDDLNADYKGIQEQ
ncbi:hypothetical protein K492DRAFT_127101 [Lichtheimia hyalospora FSU 10163]|nr:hypothetical protein K492DRAFT_127101 [Lichtheimia hyalospora FSU 10163]